MPLSQIDYEEQDLRTRTHGSSVGAALTVILDTLGVGAKLIEIYIKSSGPANFEVYRSQDGVTYTHCEADGDTFSLSGAGDQKISFTNAYRFIKVTTEATNDNEIEIVAQRGGE